MFTLDIMRNMCSGMNGECENSHTRKLLFKLCCPVVIFAILSQHDNTFVLLENISVYSNEFLFCFRFFFFFLNVQLTLLVQCVSVSGYHYLKLFSVAFDVFFPASSLGISSAEI